MEIPSGPPGPDADTVETSPEVDLLPHEQNLIDARNHLVLSSQNARQWAVENPLHPASYLMVRADIGDQDRIQALRRIESISLPAPLKQLLEASRYFQECQLESLQAGEAERVEADRQFSESSDDEIFVGLQIAYLNLLRGYRNWGGYRYQGRTRPKDKCDYPGPVIWSEQDAAFRFAKALETEFPGRVHLNLGVSKRTSPAWNPDLDRAHSVPIAVSQRGLSAGHLDRERFRNLRHDLFIGVKWLEKSRWTRSDRALKRCREIQRDLNALERSLETNRCEMAAMLIVDDEGFLDFHIDQFEWPDEVIPLIASPGAVHDEGLGNGSMDPFLAEIDEFHERNCPLCR